MSNTMPRAMNATSTKAATSQLAPSRADEEQRLNTADRDTASKNAVNGQRFFFCFFGFDKVNTSNPVNEWHDPVQICQAPRPFFKNKLNRATPGINLAA